jgi:hypothetical protein
LTYSRGSRRPVKLRFKISALERLMSGVRPSFWGGFKTPCWNWQGAICNKGYGLIRAGGRTWRCHILAWVFAAGRRVKPGYTLDHLCRNTKCCRPSHMEEVTRAENTARGNYANPRSTEHLRKK